MPPGDPMTPAAHGEGNGDGNRNGNGDGDGKTRLVVLYGGRSAEHEVSCVSAFHVLRAVDSERYDVRVVGITTQGRWVEGPSETAIGPASDAAGALPSPDSLALSSPPAPGQRQMSEQATYIEPVHMVANSMGDGPLVVLPLLHGPMGEDGTLQGLLELAGVPYCGAAVAGSAVAMDKGLAKALWAAAGIPHARYVSVREGQADSGALHHLLERVEAELGWPVFVKPANMGSSIGISKVDEPSQLAAAIEMVRRYDEFVVIEEAVSGRELEIGVLGWPELRASVPGEIRPSHEFYDYDDKYLDGRAELVVPAELPAGIAARMAELAVEACRALRVDCMARVDFFFEEAGRGLLVNEVNTVPGFTPISMYPRLWAESGVSYGELIDELVRQALRRAERRSKLEVHRPAAPQ